MKYYYHPYIPLKAAEHYIIANDDNTIKEIWVCPTYGERKWEHVKGGPYIKVRKGSEELSKEEFEKRLFIELL